MGTIKHQMSAGPILTCQTVDLIDEPLDKCFFFPSIFKLRTNEDLLLHFSVGGSSVRAVRSSSDGPIFYFIFLSKIL